MAGGNWTSATVNAAGTRPGVYINFQAAAEAAISPSNNGIVAIAGISNWGPSELVTELLTEQDIIDNFGNVDDATATLYRQARQAFIGGANKVLAFRMVGATPVKATKTLVDTTGGPINTIRIDGKYVGTFGNSFKLTIADDATDSAKTSIKLYFNTTLLATWITTINHGSAGFTDEVVALINNDTANIWIDAVKLADGNNDLADITASALASGANGDAIAGTDFDAAETAFALEDWNVFATETVDDTIRTDIAAWIEDLRDSEGKKVIGVVGSATSESVGTAVTNATGINHEGIVYVYPGAILPNAAGVDTTYNGAKITARIAGMIAAKPLGSSVTHDTITSGADAEVRLSDANIRTLIAAGVMPIVWNGRRVVIEKGITTLYSPGTKPASFNKITVVMAVDSIANTIKETAEDQFIGKVTNDAAGQLALVNSVSDFLASLAQRRVITPTFSVVIDPDQDSSGDQVFLLIGVQPLDAMEKMFTTVEIS